MRQAADFFGFMAERERIRLRREAGSPAPWTQDDILAAYKFTNVRRQHDRTSRELIEDFYSRHSNSDKSEILLNCALFRYFGTIEFARAIGWQDPILFDPERVKSIAKTRLSEGQRVFTGAYVITNQGIAAPKQNVVVDYFIKGLFNALSGLIHVVETTNKWEDLIAHMKNVVGFGGTGFMAKEVVLDTMYTGFWGPVNVDGFSFPSDWLLYTPIGPGALRGAARLLGHDDPKAPGTKISQVKAASLIRDLCDFQGDYWPEEFGKLAPHDIQFQLCEWDKYQRVLLGQGRPRSRFRSG
jgi:hypothetical protein